MKTRGLPGSTLLELKKDINTPSQYVRAGEIKTKKEWKKEFPGAFNFDVGGGNDQWFINKSIPAKKVDTSDSEYAIMNKVFKKHGLMSMTYKSAAVICMKQYKKNLAKHSMTKLEFYTKLLKKLKDIKSSPVTHLALDNYISEVVGKINKNTKLL